MSYHEGLGETLIPAINRLHDIFAQVYAACIFGVILKQSKLVDRQDCQGFDAFRWMGQVSVEVKLDLPQIAVVGSQSSGKSSVLEGLVCTVLTSCT